MASTDGPDEACQGGQHRGRKTSQACSYFVLRSFALFEGQHRGFRFARLIKQVTKRTERLVEWLDMTDGKEVGPFQIPII